MRGIDSVVLKVGPGVSQKNGSLPSWKAPVLVAGGLVGYPPTASDGLQ